jgi:hypothetical protein
VGPHAVEFLGPRRAGGAVEQWVARRGPGPFEALLRVPGGRFGPLDAHRTGGARLVLQP